MTKENGKKYLGCTRNAENYFILVKYVKNTVLSFTISKFLIKIELSASKFYFLL